MTQSRLEDLSPVVKKINVEVDPETVQIALDAAYTRLSRTVKLKGFRPGHAPRRLVEQYFKGQVEGDVAKKLVETTIGDALTKHAVAPLDVRVTEQDEVLVGKSFKYTARAEVRPKVAIKDYRGLEVTAEKVDVLSSAVDEELERMRQTLAQVAPIEGRDVAQAGDIAMVDYVLTVDGAPIKGATSEGAGIRVEPGSFLEGRCEALVGTRIGETRNVETGFAADYRVADLRGKTGVFAVTLRGLKRRDVPVMDDEFAKDVGVPTLADLRAKVEKDLRTEAQRKNDLALRDALFRALLAKNPVEAPPALVERNVDAMLEGMLQSFARRGVDPRQLGLDFERMRGEMRERATLEVQGALLLDAICEVEKIAPSDADVETAIEKAASDAGQPVAKVRAHYREAAALMQLKTRLKHDRALDVVKTAATIK